MYMTKRDGSFASPPRRATDPREYGRSGLFGLLTPQGNPTAEPEMRILLPSASAMLAARLTSASPSLEQRLTDYVDGLAAAVDSFDTVPFDAIGFACTGCSYRMDPEDERQRVEAIVARKGYPVITAAAAMKAALNMLEVRTLALISPYPAWLTDACREYWERQGLSVRATLQLPVGKGQTHGIYGLRTPAVVAAAAGFDSREAQAILITGTGMPSLRAIVTLEQQRSVPVLSANLCLAWALAGVTGKCEPGTGSRLYGGWAARLAAA